MANVVKLSGNECCSDAILDRIYVEDQFSAITTGSTIQLQRGDQEYCLNVLTVEVGVFIPNHTLLDVFTTCEKCLSGITNAVQIETCTDVPEVYFIDINSFTTLPTIGDIYYINIIVNDKIIENCFTISCYVNNFEDTLYNINSISDPYTGCTECILNNLTSYSVTTCDGTTNHCIDFPPGFDYTGYLVSFTDTLGEIFCGTVDNISIGCDISGTLISIFGPISDELTCDACLAISTEKRIIVDCLNSNNTQVVWGSVFYEGSEITNLSTNEGCFSVGDLTESAVTTNAFLNFDPQPDCQECIQCTGIYYTYSSCTETGPINACTYDSETVLTDGNWGPFTGTTNGNGIGATFYFEISGGIIVTTGIQGGVGYQVGDLFYIDNPPFTNANPFVIEITQIQTVGSFFSYQYVEDAIGKTVFIPQLNNCVEIILVQNSSDGYNFTIHSFDVYDNCPQCEEESNNYFIWKTEECGSGIQNIIVTTNGSLINGDFVKVLRSNMDFQCNEILEPYVYDGFGYNVYKSNTVTPFDDCPTCNSGTLIGASIVKCGGGGQQFVNIPIQTWNQMAYLESQSIFVLQQYGQCYGLLNTCPLEPIYTTINPIETYYNCISCSDDNTRTPMSANTESFFCVKLCTESGTTVVSIAGPHPIYTDLYGTPVTQLNMFALGGTNGLNN